MLQMWTGNTAPISSQSQRRSCGTSCSTAREGGLLPNAAAVRTAWAPNDARKARVVELRFFGGLSVDETAAVLAVSPETVMRDWKFARSWLHAELARG